MNKQLQNKIRYYLDKLIVEEDENNNNIEILRIAGILISSYTSENVFTKDDLIQFANNYHPYRRDLNFKFKK